LSVPSLALAPNSFSGDAALDLETDVDDGDVLLDGHHDALGNIAFGKVLRGKDSANRDAKSSVMVSVL
jgi:hypothetical protein